MSTFVRRIWCSLIPFKVHVDRDGVGETDECDGSVSRGGENHVARTLLLIKLLHISPDKLCPTAVCPQDGPEGTNLGACPDMLLRPKFLLSFPSSSARPWLDVVALKELWPREIGLVCVDVEEAHHQMLIKERCV